MEWNFLMRIVEIVSLHRGAFGPARSPGGMRRRTSAVDRKEPISASMQRDLPALKALSEKILSPDLLEEYLYVEEQFDRQRHSRDNHDLSSLPGLDVASSDVAAPGGNDGENLRRVAEIFARAIDRKSVFTRRHSRGVARVAALLAKVMGFDHEGIAMMEVAGLLHDVGKLSIPDDILEKPAPLTREEFSVIRQHTYFTFCFLQAAGAPSVIRRWAGHHHEKLNGSGYPFHLEAVEISKGSRIMAVADIFTALHEDRPYRSSMEKMDIERILRKMAAENDLDCGVVDCLFDIYPELHDSLLDLEN